MSELTQAKVQGGLLWAIRDAQVVAGRSLKKLTRVPEQLVFGIIQPIMFVILFRYVFGGAISTPGVNYVNFLMAGIFVQTLAFGAIGTGIGLADDLHKGIIDRFRSLPMANSAVLAGATLSELVKNFVTVAIMAVVGFAVGFRPEGSPLEWLTALGLLALFTYAFSWVGATVGLLVRSVEAAQTSGFIWLFPLTFASSAFVPVESMPSWLQGFARNQPISQVVDAVRALLTDTPALPLGNHFWVSIAWCVGLLVVFGTLSVSLFRKTAAR